ncbi:MAG: extensin family protein [Flavobacteriaceae bacterium]
MLAPMGRMGFRAAALALAGALALSACSAPSFRMFGDGNMSREEIDANRWRDSAEAACLGSKSVVATAYAMPKEPVDGPGICGIRRPFALSGLAHGRVEVKPSATINCQMVAALERWIDKVVQPAAFIRFGQRVVSIKNIASYGCRTRNSRAGAKISEHAFGNALDVAAFTLSGGREISVKDDWDSFFGLSRSSGFLHAVHSGSCDIFATVIGPDGDSYHQDHFHLDLARHPGGNGYCK